MDTFCRDALPPAEQWPRITFDLPTLHYPDRLNAADVLLTGAAADRRCLLSPTEELTYAQVRERAGAIAAVLVADGLVPGNRVLLRGPNNPWLVASWLGVLLAGGVAVPTMPLLRAGELTTICAAAKVDRAICDHRFLADLAAADVPGLRILPYGADTPDDLTTLAAGHDGAAFTPVRTAADDVALLAFTSGTTGRPKATMHLHRDLLAVADTFSAHVLRPEPDDLFVGSPPLAFTFGLGALVLFPLRVGAASLLLERATPDVVPDRVAEYGATVLFTSPTGYRMMLAAGAADRLAGLRRCVSAGEALPAAVWEAFRAATGIRIIDGIGSTEMLHIFISAADDDIRPGSTGKPVPGYQARVVDDLGKPVPDGVVGKLAVRGPTGCRYLADDRQTAYVRDGWNVTGDAYVRDADGYFWYQARTDDMIVSSGYNISGPEVEAALQTHPDVLEAGVVGAPDRQRGEIPRAFVVLRSGVPAPDRAAAVIADLQDHVKQTIAPYKYPRSIVFVEALPRGETGKLQRFRLREPTVRVTTGRRAVATTDDLSAYLALADRYGRDQVFLLSSTAAEAGPVPERRRRYLGFGELLTVSVTRGVVSIAGVPALVVRVRDRVAPLLDGDRLVHPADLWPVLRAVASVLDAQGSATEFRFGFLGYFGYDAVRYVEDLPYLISDGPDLPDVHLVLYSGVLVSDPDTGRSELLTYSSDAWPAVNPNEVCLLLAGAERTNPAPTGAEVPPSTVSDDTECDDFLRTVDRCQQHIAVGDIYQVQIGHELTMRSAADPVAVYQRLRTRNASPYTYLTSIAGHTVIGASPEVFVRVEDGTIVTRPIAGTMPRFGADDEAAARWLRSDPKELAEHVMLIDLCRNDIGRICKPNSLSVPDQLVVERYSHVLHLVSTVVGEAEPEADAFDIIAALFPAGTMTGTPKIRAMEIIEQQENRRRGLYAGALGLIDVDGFTDLALCIRTLIHRDGEYVTRASAGIVADSVSSREWTETLAKSSAAVWAVTGRELL